MGEEGMGESFFLTQDGEQLQSSSVTAALPLQI